MFFQREKSLSAARGQLAASPEFTKAGVSTDVGEAGRPVGQTKAGDAAERLCLTPVVARNGSGRGMIALRGVSRKCLEMHYLTGLLKV